MPAYFAEDVNSIVEHALDGFAQVHSHITEVVRDPLYVLATQRNPRRQVGLVSGGGSGHEPLHIGFVGEGMLDAACPGKIFTSPHNRQIYAASKAVAGSGGVLHIVKNYTGDLINFGIAAERLAKDGIPCSRVVVEDDVATDSASVAIGRRGTGAALIVEKLLGAAADRGDSLDQLVSLGNYLSANARSIAVASAAHTSPQTGSAAFQLEGETVEYGVGIHGERSNLKPLALKPHALIKRMVNALLASLVIEPGTPTVLLVNNLGGSTELELYAMTSRILQELSAAEIKVSRVVVGPFVTALDMRGFSVSLASVDEQLLGLWDARAVTAAWPAAGVSYRNEGEK